jgi:L-aspartate oxidase
VRVHERFPTVAEICRQVGLDLAVDPIPVGPAAHYLMGGVDTDDWGRTSIPGLFAAGETACTGVHGANRLASNSLLEGLVFGARAAEAMQQPPRVAVPKADRVEARGSRLDPPVPGAPSEGSALSIAAVRDLMWRAAGLLRTRQALQEAAVQLEASSSILHVALNRSAQPSADEWRHFNLVTVARLIVRAALRREESRGGHFRADFPARDDLHWKVHLVDIRPD